MPEPTDFPTLLRRLRAGDHDAVVEFFKRYGRAVRIVAHVRRVRYNLSPADMDSEEVQLSVLGSFCVRAQMGQFDLASEDALRGLLYRMAHHKAVDCARKAWREDEVLDAWARRFTGAIDGDSVWAIISEEMRRARALCSDEEWDLIQRRKAEQSWEEIGRAFGVKPDTVRKRYERLVERLESALGLVGVRNE
jgi:DNA-directed RNA polymerase specialized sigma24 family protein